MAGVGAEPKMFQKRRVSSAEAETMVAPSGDCGVGGWVGGWVWVG